MARQITNHDGDKDFRDDIGQMFESNLRIADMRPTRRSIIEGIQMGDPAAQERFMRRYGDPCRCYYETGHWAFDHETAKDLAAEVRKMSNTLRQYLLEIREQPRGLLNDFKPLVLGWVDPDGWGRA